MLNTGIYEQVIYQALRTSLDATTDYVTSIGHIDKAEASIILANYISDILQKSFAQVLDNGGNLQTQVALANQIVKTLIHETGEASLGGLVVDEQAEQLLALIKKRNSILSIEEKVEIIRPETSVAHSSLFTGAVHEPSMVIELKKEILSCDRIELLVSFIKWSGLRLIIDELQTFAQKGGTLRIITTSYMGATDVKAIEELSKLPNTAIKISYDTKRTRLHAKTYVFYRNTGFTTAYVGSSNLSNVAISSGLEWNIKVAAKDQPNTLKKIQATFESYWNSNEFEDYTQQQQARLESAINAEKRSDLNSEHAYLFDVYPYPYQQEILDRLEADRTIRGHFKNLIVAATGTGKTVISAFDYKHFCKLNSNKPNRLLFVAHREEILKQSIACFQGILKDPNFGDLFVGNHKPDSLDHLFISIQTFNAQQFQEKTSPEFYDYIIVDEFHHAAAPTYKTLLTHYKPKILLGLTATPERMDGQSVLEYFDDRIAAEIRLPEAIDRKLLCPFQYFGVTDTINLDQLKWTRGRYDISELSNLYTRNLSAANQRAHLVISSLKRYVTDLSEVKGLGFCVSVDHAKFMESFFNEQGIPSISLTGTSLENERFSAKERLIKGEIRFIFVVDIYNEGVDIPDVNTVLFLRPTESLTVFLQQLGRGLRLAENKECLTALDFIGLANRNYNFEDKFSAMLSFTRKSIQQEIKNGFSSVPKGCFIQLERKAKDYVLDNIRKSFSVGAGLISRIATFYEDSGLPLTLQNFTSYYHLDVRTIYKRDNFSRLKVKAGIKPDFSETLEDTLTKAFPRISAINSQRWIRFLLDALQNAESLSLPSLSAIEKRMLDMFQFTVWQKSAEECGFSDTLEGLRTIKANSILVAELIELLHYNFEHIDFIDKSVDIGFECPLDLHCTYSRDQIFIALDFMKPSTVREGVKYLPDKNVDVFLITLNKSDKDYSPSTMYNDYSINDTLFHMQSQSTTSEESTTGQRYIHHQDQGNRMLLFVREFKNEIGFVSPYTFLGLADYVIHEGSRPMNITWKLQEPIPAKFLRKTNKLLIG